jgi:anti-sigma-K factor RskA
MKTLLTRFLSPTPAFWQKVRNATVVVAGAAEFILHYEATPEQWKPVLKTVATIAATAAFVAQLTCKDSSTDPTAP